MTSAPTREQITDRLGTTIDPDLQQGLVRAGLVRDVEVTGHLARIMLELTAPACPMRRT